MTDFGTLDTVLSNFTTAISGVWGPQLFFYLQPLMFMLIVLQFGLVAAEAAITHDVPLVIVHLFLGIIRVGVVWAIFNHAFDWGNSIVQTGQILGSNISGFGLTPSGVFDNGINVTHTILATKAAGSWFSQTFENLEFFFVGVFVMLAWAIASIIYLGALIEAVLLVYVGPLIIAFTPLSWTFEMLLLWGRSLLAIAFRTALILMTLAIGMVLANQWTAAVITSSSTFTTNIWNLLITIVEAMLFAYAVLKIPNRISGLAGGAAMIGFGEALLDMAGSGAGAAYGALSGGSGSRTSEGGSGGGGDGGGNGGAPNNGGSASNTSPQQGPTAQELAAKVQTALLKG